MNAVIIVLIIILIFYAGVNSILDEIKSWFHKNDKD